MEKQHNPREEACLARLERQLEVSLAWALGLLHPHKQREEPQQEMDCLAQRELDKDPPLQGCKEEDRPLDQCSMESRQEECWEVEDCSEQEAHHLSEVASQI